MDTTPAVAVTVTVTVALSIAILLIHLLRHPTGANHRPSSHPILGNLVAFLRNYHRFLDWASDLLAASPTNTIQVDTPFNLSHGVCTADPRNVEHLLKSNFANYVKGQRQYDVLSDVLGNGIFNSDGHLWFLQRKVASREFTTRSLKSFVAEIVVREIETQLIPLLSGAADTGRVVDLQDVLRRFAFDNICTLAFGTDPNCLNLNSNIKPEPFFVAFDDAVRISSERFFSPIAWIWKLKRILNLGSERKLKEAIRIIDDYAFEIINFREQEHSGSNDKQDLLSRFSAMTDENVSGDKDKRRQFLRDMIISFVLAGKDSTSSALTWLFWLLTQNPDCENKLHDEIRSSGFSSSYEDLKQLPYLHAAVSEALRLYPPVPINSRVAVEADELPDGTRVGKGWFADYSAYAMGRSERVWGERCGEFRPERWIGGDGTVVAVEAWRFPVFHGGARTCLGREMAYVQMKAVAAAVVREFVVEVAEEGREVEMELALTLKMKGGFPVRIKRRVLGSK